MNYNAIVLCLWICFVQQSRPHLLEPDIDFGVPTLILDTLQLTLSSKLLLDVQSPRSTTLRGYLGWSPLTSNLTYAGCQQDARTGSICLEYSRDMRLTISQDSGETCDGDMCYNVPCYEVRWQNHVAGVMDCFLLEDDLWYGGGTALAQRWPRQNESRTWHASVTGDPLHHASGSVVENLWLSARGFAVHVDDDTPLFVSFNDSGSNKLCFTTSNSRHPYGFGSSRKDLVYSICAARSIKVVHDYASKKWFKKPRDIPDSLVFKYPIWSTWARYKTRIDQKTILEFAKQIKKSEFPFSQLEIDDNWETCYGSMTFNKTIFPNPVNLVRKLKGLGFRVTLWVHPFCNLDCDVYPAGAAGGYWVKDEKGQPVVVKWWNGVAAMLDVTNSDAVEWFVSRLKQLQMDFGIDGFKFDAGEVSWLASPFKLHSQEASSGPNTYSKLYAEMASRFGGLTEVRSAYRTQDLPVFLRMFDKFSSWGADNGLRTLIPSALQLSLMGYPFILPDMVGGNNYDSPDLPDKELYVRWLQANVFLPSIQFSIAPWDYDDETIEISRKMLDLRDRYSGLIVSLAKQTMVTGDAIIRPVWHLAPDDIEALTIDTQFLLGDTVLVAPVLERNRRSRSVYLPEGRWTDVQRSNTYEGPQWLYKYKAPKDYLPFFIRQT